MVERIDPEARTETAPLTVSTPSVAPEEQATLVAGRYQILGLVGAGAMGTVYRARDRELDELIALKVLKKEVARTEGMLDRFRREVKLARRVTHRNVARMYDIGEHGGDKFLTMEFIEGEGLAALLERRGMLMPGEAVGLAMDVLSGLEAAHSANVLHRDLKPENVIVGKDGRAVITDFGIARATEADLSWTQGGVAGTPAYMAPEQVEGVRDLDARTDLYSLGTMFYELITGELAWNGPSIVAVAGARLVKPPPDPRQRLPGLSTELAEIVLKLMARKREDRYASATEALEALRQLELLRFSAPEVGTRPSVRSPRGQQLGTKSVAVLPVLNLGVADDEYLATNLTEDLADDLSIVPSLRVRPWGTTEKYTDATRDVREIGRKHAVDVVVDASLRRIGDLVRATVRLVTVRDGFQLWAKRFDRPPAEVLAIASEAAQAVARALTAETEVAETIVPRDPIATDLFLRGRYMIRRGWFDAARDGRKLVGRAHERAPDEPLIAGTYALALAREFGNSPGGPDMMNEARRVAEGALAIAPDQPEARVTLGLLHLYNGDPIAAILELRRALVTSPNDTDAIDTIARIESEVGRVEDAFRRFKQAIGIAGDRRRLHFQMARLKFLLGDEETSDVPPDAEDVSELVAWTFLRARVCLWRSDRAGAKRLGVWFAGLNARSVVRPGIEATIRVATTGRAEEADREILSQMLPIDGSRSRRNSAFHGQMRCELFLAVGEKENALAALCAADENGLLDLVWLEKCPQLALICHEPQFQEVLANTKARAARVMEALDA